MSSLQEIPLMFKKIEDSPKETTKLLFKLIFGETVRFNRKKLKSFTGFHFDHKKIETKITQVTEDFCICKLKTITSLLSLDQGETGREMAESICVLLNDISKLQQRLVEYAELKRARSNTQLSEESNQQLCKSSRQSTSLQGNLENETAAKLNLKRTYQNANKCNLEYWGSIELHCTRLTTIPQDSKKLGDLLITAFTVNVKLEHLGCTVEAILDTGSPISFLNYSMIPKSLKFESSDNRHQFRGVTGSKINIIGQFKQTVVTEECEKQVNFYVIPNGALSSSCLLGRDYISQIVLTLDKGISIISDKTHL